MGLLRTLPGVGLPNGSIWTIPFEILCYFLVAAFGLLGWLRRPPLVAGLAVLLLVALNWPSLGLLPMHWPPFGSRPLPYIGWLWPLPMFATYFLSGALFFLFRDRIPHAPWLLAVSALLVALTLGSLPLAGLFFWIFPTFGLYLLFFLAFLPLDNLHAWARRGDLSYGVYLYAYPLQRLIIAGQGHSHRLTPLTLFLLAWPLACLAAVLSWRLVERPFLKLKPRSPLPPAEQTGAPAVPAAGS